MSDKATQEQPCSDIDGAIKQIANDASLYGFTGEELRELWFEVMMEKVARKDKKH